MNKFITGRSVSLKTYGGIGFENILYTAKLSDRNFGGQWAFPLLFSHLMFAEFAAHLICLNLFLLSGLCGSRLFCCSTL